MQENSGAKKNWIFHPNK